MADALLDLTGEDTNEKKYRANRLYGCRQINAGPAAGQAAGL